MKQPQYILFVWCLLVEHEVLVVIYLTIEITINVTSILCAKKGWKEENGAGLSIFGQLNNQE